MFTTADSLPVQLFTGVDTTLYATGFYTGEVHSSAVAMITLAESGSTAKAFEINNGTTPVLSIADIKNVSTTVPILVVTNIKEAVSKITSATQTVIIKTIDGGTTFLTIYSLINNPLSASEITYRLYIQEVPSKKILAEGKIAISPDNGLENILSTTALLTHLPAGSSDTANPLFLTPQASTPDSLQVKLLASVLFHASIAHNSPKANEIEETAGIYTNYIQYFDNIVRNWGSVNDSTVGLPRLRAIYKVVKDQNAGVVADNVWALNHGTLAEFGKPVQERKNYAFYEGYSRLYFDLERPVYNAGIQTGSGIQMKISDNIELYKANLADTFNMFDTAIINGTTARRLIVNAKDSLLNKVNTDGLWVKGIAPDDENDKADKIWYTGVSAVRLPILTMAGGVKVDTAFSVGVEKMGAGDPEGKIVGGPEHSILKMYDLNNDGEKIDTIYNDKFANMFLHGQSKILEIDSTYSGNDSIDFFKIENDSNANKVSIEKNSKYRATFQDTATFSDLLVAAMHYSKGNKPAAVFYYKTASKKILLKDAYDGILRQRTGCTPYYDILVEMSISSWFDKEFRENGEYYFHKSSPDIRLFTSKECRPFELCWPDEKIKSSKNGVFYEWEDFYTEILNKPKLWFIYKSGPEKKWFKIEYVNKKDRKLKKTETFVFGADQDYNQQLNLLKGKVSELCDCKRSNIQEYTECTQEANEIANDYLNVWGQNANSEESYGYAKGARDLMNPNLRVKSLNVGDIHSGWYCYQWAFFVYSRLYSRHYKHFLIQRSGYLGSDINGNPGENMLHNWVTIFVCGSTMTRETDGGLHLDPWINNKPIVNTAAEHELLLNRKRNFVSTEKPIKDGYKGVFVNDLGIPITKEKYKKFEW